MPRTFQGISRQPGLGELVSRPANFLWVNDMNKLTHGYSNHPIGRALRDL